MEIDEHNGVGSSTPAPKGRNNGLYNSTIPSSSPAFATPVHPVARRSEKVQPVQSTILPVLLPQATLRPLAFRVFTKKHSLNLTSTALQTLATFVGKNCGPRWRDEGLAEGVLEEVAKAWKRRGGGLIVDGDSNDLIAILHEIEGLMVGGRVNRESSLSRTNSTSAEDESTNPGLPLLSRAPSALSRADSQTSFGMSSLEVDEYTEEQRRDSKYWFRVIGAFEQPQFTYNADKRHFERSLRPHSLLPDPLSKTTAFRDRYNLVLQRLLRNDSFQAPSVAPSRASALHRTASITQSQTYKLTPIANLLGRSGTSHVLLGLITISPAGGFTLTDLTGSVAMDITHAKAVPEDGAWFTPGMIVIVDGLYAEEGLSNGSGLGFSGGIGGMIGGKFTALSIGGPPCERRDVTLGIDTASKKGASAHAGFGWVDFLGVGSERSSGSRMRELEKNVFNHHISKDRARVIVLGEVSVDNPRSITALRKVLHTYSSGEEDAPQAFIIAGNFVTHAAMAGNDDGGSVEFKEHLDALASALADFSTLLQHSKFVFVPGDNDPWPSASAAGAATVLPRTPVPDLFTSRIKKAFSSAYSEAGKPVSEVNNNVVWTTNPSRISLFGPVHEIVLFRDDMTSRIRRNAIKFAPPESTPGEYETMDANIGTSGNNLNSESGAENFSVSAQALNHADIHTAKKLVKTILDQGHLSPFPLATRPIHWDHSGPLQLYPLPTSLVIIDPQAPPFTLTYEGCHVMNPGPLVADARRGIAKWVEYDAATRRGIVRDALF